MSMLAWIGVGYLVFDVVVLLGLLVAVHNAPLRDDWDDDVPDATRSRRWFE